MRYLRAFGAFWYDFLVGDRPELFVGPIIALVLTWLIVRAGASGLVAGVFLFASICLVGATSLWLVLRKRSS
jgi:hypothetical protein